MDRKQRFLRLGLAAALALALLVAFLPAQAAVYRQGSQGSAVRTKSCVAASTCKRNASAKEAPARCPPTQTIPCGTWTETP